MIAILVLDGVTIVDVEQGRLVPSQRVIVTGNRIDAVETTRAVKIPKAARSRRYSSSRTTTSRAHGFAMGPGSCADGRCPDVIVWSILAYLVVEIRPLNG